MLLLQYTGTINSSRPEHHTNTATQVYGLRYAPGASLPRHAPPPPLELSCPAEVPERSLALIWMVDRKSPTQIGGSAVTPGP